MTNYEIIKKMSIEEMAVTIMCPNDIGMAEIKCDKLDDCNCCKCCGSGRGNLFGRGEVNEREVDI